MRGMEQYAASLPPRRRGEVRSLARLWREGNPPEADEPSMVDQAGEISRWAIDWEEV